MTTTVEPVTAPTTQPTRVRRAPRRPPAGPRFRLDRDPCSGEIRLFVYDEPGERGRYTIHWLSSGDLDDLDDAVRTFEADTSGTADSDDLAHDLAGER